MMRTLYDSMRPFVSGGCYVNYCGLDLGDGGVLGRQSAEADEDQGASRSENIFKHAQSVPLS
jgi:hypothetical protein